MGGGCFSKISQWFTGVLILFLLISGLLGVI